MFAAVACLFGRSADASLTRSSSQHRSFVGSGRPACPAAKGQYKLRKAGHCDYTVMDGSTPVGHAFRLDGFEPGASLWTVRAYDVDREVNSLWDAKAWLAGGDPPAPDQAY